MQPNTATDWISSLSSAFTALVTVGLLLAALWAAKAARDTLAQMRADSRAQADDSARAVRPYVYARLVPSLAGVDAWDLVIENTGRTAAYDLTFDVTNPEHEDDDAIRAGIDRLARAALTLPPGASIRCYWFIGSDQKAEPTNAQGYERASLSLHYADERGTRFDEQPTPLEPDALGLTPVPSTGSVASTRARNAHHENMAHALRAIAMHTGEANR